MNNKGLTDVILVLILSGIAVALIFTGIIYTYSSLACYTGINLTESRFLSPAYAGQMGASVIELIENESEMVDFVNNVPQNVTYTFKIRYMGASVSRVAVQGSEKQSLSDIADIYREITPNILTVRGEYTFVAKFPVYPNCSADFIVIFSAPDTNGVSEYVWSHPNDYCMTPPIKDINVSVNNITYNGNQIDANVSITGSDVEVLCPRADISFGVRRNTFQVGDAVLVNNSGGLCTFVIDTNTTRVNNNGWYNDAYDFRTPIQVTNTFGTSIPKDEVVQVDLNLSVAKIGFDLNITNCTTKIVVTKADGTTWLKKNVTLAEYNNQGGHCSRAVIQFNADDQAGTWNSGVSRTYYIYSTDNATIIAPSDAGFAPNNPSFEFTSFNKAGYANSSEALVLPSSVSLRCTLCGTPGEKCCATNPACGGQNICNAATGKCEACGASGQKCCPTQVSCGGCNSGLSCQGTTCSYCGAFLGTCCVGTGCTACSTAGTACSGTTCRCASDYYVNTATNPPTCVACSSCTFGCNSAKDGCSGAKCSVYVSTRERCGGAANCANPFGNEQTWRGYDRGCVGPEGPFPDYYYYYACAGTNYIYGAEHFSCVKDESCTSTWTDFNAWVHDGVCSH